MTLFKRIGFAALVLACWPAVWASAGTSATPQSTPAPTQIKSDLASFKKAASEAAKIEDDPAAEKYKRDKLYPYFGPRYASVMQNCFKTVPHPSTKSFSFIIAVDKAGGIEEINTGKSTNIALCLVREILTDRFPPPPFSPFVERIDMEVSH